ncbi:MAG: LPS assembly lipoprotein LptE, partial [Thermoleophilaceae bacterium]
MPAHAEAWRCGPMTRRTCADRAVHDAPGECAGGFCSRSDPSRSWTAGISSRRERRGPWKRYVPEGPRLQENRAGLRRHRGVPRRPRPGPPPGLVVELRNERFDERVLSVDPRTGKAREYQIAYRVDLAVRHSDRRPLIKNQTIDLLRDFTFDETAALGKFEEQQVL